MLDLLEVTLIEAQAYKCRGCGKQLRVGQMVMLVKNQGADVPLKASRIHIHLSCLRGFLDEAEASPLTLTTDKMLVGLRSMVDA